MLIEKYNSGEHTAIADGLNVNLPNGTLAQFHPSISFRVPHNPRSGDLVCENPCQQGELCRCVRSADYKIPMSWSKGGHGYTFGTLLAMGGDVFWTYEQVSDYKIQEIDLVAAKTTHSMGMGPRYLSVADFRNMVDPKNRPDLVNLGVIFTDVEKQNPSLVGNNAALESKRALGLNKVIYYLQNRISQPDFKKFLITNHNMDGYTVVSDESGVLDFDEIIKMFREYGKYRFMSGFYTLYDPGHDDADFWGKNFGGVRDHTGKIFDTDVTDKKFDGAQSLGDNIDSIFQLEKSALKNAIQQGYSKLAMSKQSPKIDMHQLNKYKRGYDDGLMAINAMQPNKGGGPTYFHTKHSYPENSWNKFYKPSIELKNPTLINEWSTTPSDSTINTPYTNAIMAKGITMMDASAMAIAENVANSAQSLLKVTADKIGIGPKYITKYLSILIKNNDHFETDAAWVYTIGHELALDHMAAAASIKDVNNQLKAFNKALAIEAFSNHFLTDLFAGGHTTTPARDLRKGVGDEAGGALTNAMHDEQNAYGYEVTNQENREDVQKNGGDLKTWKAFGDYSWISPENAQNRRKMWEAVQASASEVIKYFFDTKRAVVAGSQILPVPPPPEVYKGSLKHPSLPNAFKNMGVYIKADFNKYHTYAVNSSTRCEDDETCQHDIPIRICSAPNQPNCVGDGVSGPAQAIKHVNNCDDNSKTCAKMGMPSGLWECEKGVGQDCKKYQCSNTRGHAILCKRRNILNEHGTGDWLGQPLYMKDKEGKLWKRGSDYRHYGKIWQQDGQSSKIDGGGGIGRTRIDATLAGFTPQNKIKSEQELERTWAAAGFGALPSYVQKSDEYTVRTSPYLLGIDRIGSPDPRLYPTTGMINYDVNAMRGGAIRKIDDKSGTLENPRNLINIKFTDAEKQDWRNFYNKNKRQQQSVEKFQQRSTGCSCRM